jgi:hypothetical protein
VLITQRIGLSDSFLIAAITAAEFCASPVSTTRTPSSPVWTAMFPPAPTSM